MNPDWKDLAEDWYTDRLLKDGVPVDFGEGQRKIPPAYSRADDSTRSRDGRRDDES